MYVTGEDEVSITNGHHGGPALGKRLAEKTTPGPDVVHCRRARCDRDNIDTQRIPWASPLDRNRPGGCAHFWWFLICPPHAFVGVPRLHHQLLARGDGDRCRQAGVKDSRILVPDEALHRLYLPSRLPSILDVDDRDIEDHMLPSQGMVEIDGHGIVLDGMNAKRNDTAAWSCHFAAIPDIQRRVWEALPGQLLKGLWIDTSEGLFRSQFEEDAVPCFEPLHALGQTGGHSSVPMDIRPRTARRRGVDECTIRQ